MKSESVFSPRDGRRALPEKGNSKVIVEIEDNYVPRGPLLCCLRSLLKNPPGTMLLPRFFREVVFRKNSSRVVGPGTGGPKRSGRPVWEMIIFYFFSFPDPIRWTEEDVKAWLLWTVRQFSLPMINTDCFNMDGAAFCQLTEEEFQQRAPQVCFREKKLTLLTSLPRSPPR